MTPVILESPWQGGAAENVLYLQECLLDSLSRNEAPFASHALYTLALDDADDSERAQGIAAGFAWHAFATKQVIYLDRGLSGGMREGLVNFEKARGSKSVVEFRSLRGGAEIRFEKYRAKDLIDLAEKYAASIAHG